MKAGNFWVCSGDDSFKLDQGGSVFDIWVSDSSISHQPRNILRAYNQGNCIVLGQGCSANNNASIPVYACSCVQSPIVCGTTCVVTNRVKSTTGNNPGYLAGVDSTTQMYLDSTGNHRPFLKVEGNYPHIDIVASISNINHGGTLRFANTVDNKQWVIGTSACDLRWMDIGWACSSNHNPHYGIAGLPHQAGGTMMRFTCQGVLINSNNCIVYPNMPVAGSYGLDVRGTARVTGTLTGDGIICAATCIKSPIVCGTSCVISGNSWLQSTCIKGPIVCATTNAVIAAGSGTGFTGLSIGESPVNYNGWDKQLTLNGCSHSRIIAKTSSSDVRMGMYAHCGWHHGAAGYLGTYTNHPVGLIVNALNVGVISSSCLTHCTCLQSPIVCGTTCVKAEILRVNSCVLLAGGGSRIWVNNRRQLEGSADGAVTQIGEDFTCTRLHGLVYACTCIQSPYICATNCVKATTLCATGDVKIGQTLRFTQNSPYICTGGAYIVVPSGIYVNGGTLYAENTIMSRNGICDDTGTPLTLFGGNNAEKCTVLCGKTFSCTCLQSPRVYASGTAGIGIAPDATYPLMVGGNTRYQIGFCNSGASNAYYPWLVHDTDNLIVHFNAIGDVFHLHSSGYLCTTGCIKSPIVCATTAIRGTHCGDGAGLTNVPQSHYVSGSAFSTNGPDSVLEYAQASGVTDTKIAPTTDWYNSIRMGHGDPYSYYSNTIAVRMTGTAPGTLYTQSIYNGSAGGWKKHWNDTNDGAGSGLDADLLDGLQGACYYAASNPSGYTTCTGNVVNGQSLICATTLCAPSAILGGVVRGSNICATEWFRNDGSGEGLFNIANENHFYSSSPNYWHINSKSACVNGGLIFYSQHQPSPGHATGRRGYIYWDGTNNFGLLTCAGSWGVRLNGNTSISLCKPTCVVGALTGSTTICATTSLCSPIVCGTTCVQANKICLLNDVTGDMANGIVLGANAGIPQAAWGASGTTTGRIEIGLPTINGEGGSAHYGMVHVAVDVYEYNGSNAMSFIVGGHNWNCAWYNCGAHIMGGCNDKSIKVAYHSCGGTNNGRYVILLGEPGSSWTYGSVHVRRVNNGLYYSGAMNFGTPMYVKQVTCADSYYNCATVDLRANSRSYAAYQYATTCLHTPRVCATTCLRSANVCATTATYSPIVCATTAIRGTHCGNGAGLTSLNATNLATGTVATARLPAAALCTGTSCLNAISGSGGIIAGGSTTVYISHATGSPYNHIPANGTSGQFLGYSASGTAAWVNNPNTNTTYPVITATVGGVLSNADAVKFAGIATGAQANVGVQFNGAFSGLNFGGGYVSHYIGAPYNHIPANGTSGQFLGYSASGTAAWVNLPAGGVPGCGCTGNAACCSVVLGYGAKCGGYHNTHIGESAGAAGGYGNTAIGKSNAQASGTRYYNSTMGFSVGANLSSGCYNLLWGAGYLAWGVTTGSNNIFIAPSGNPGNTSGCLLIGTNQMTSGLVCVSCISFSGSVSKAAGSFRIVHPSPAKSETQDLWHSFVESPNEGDNIYRWQIETTNCTNTITLPDYYKNLNKDDMAWASPHKHFGAAYGEVTADQCCLVICSNTDGCYNVLLIGTRKDPAARVAWKGVSRDIDSNSPHVDPVHVYGDPVPGMPDDAPNEILSTTHPRDMSAYQAMVDQVNNV
jgi:hypothetical protein